MSRNGIGHLVCFTQTVLISFAVFPNFLYFPLCLSLATLQALWSWDCLFCNSAGVLEEGGADLACVHG